MIQSHPPWSAPRLLAGTRFGTRRSAASRLGLVRAARPVIALAGVAALTLASALIVLCRSYAGHRQAPFDDRAYSLQGLTEDLSGGSLAFPGGDRALSSGAGVLVLWDTEYTTWEGAHQRRWRGPGEAREVVQIAAIKVNASDGYRELASFSALVKPVKNPQLSAYFTALTKITQQEVDKGGRSFDAALSAFAQFAEGGTLPAWGYGTSDAAVVEETARVQGVAYSRESRFAGGGLHNLRPILQRCGLEPHKWTSGSIHRALGIDLGKDHVHNALFDVRSLRATLAELQKRKAKDAKCGV